MTNAAEEKMSVMIPPFGRLRMRHSEKFHPKWGYLAPAPSFIRTARVVLAATVVGAIAGAGVVFSLVAHPSSETSVALRTLTAAQVVATRSTPQKKSEPPLSALGQLTDEAASNAKTNSTAQAPAEPASARSVPLPGNPPEKTTVVPLVEATETPAPSTEQVKKKAMKKPNVTSHYAWRGADSGRWGGAYYSDRGWRYRDTW